MTSKKDDGQGERLVEALLADAFAERGELIPTTEDEVRRAEQQDLEFAGDLPESLRALRPSSEERRAPLPPQDATLISLVDARRRRASWLTHGIAAAVGAAAAAALFWGQSKGVEPGANLPTGEVPAKAAADAARPDEKITLPPAKTCGSSCCAGEACSAAKSGLSSCSSGRKCIACSNEELAASRYRLRFGAFAPTELGAKAVTSAGPGGLELCVRVGSSEIACVPAHANSDGTEQWSRLPLVASAQDLLAGFVLEVRPKLAGAKAVGAWRSPVQISPTVLCKGLSLRPQNTKEEVLGVVSVFLEDAHFVELRRDASVEALRAHRKRFVLSDVPATLFETSAHGDRKFALVLGPLDKPATERLRWSVLQGGEDARLSVGEDFVGEPTSAD
jgi:hypothetical protein